MSGARDEAIKALRVLFLAVFCTCMGYQWGHRVGDEKPTKKAGWVEPEMPLKITPLSVDNHPRVALDANGFVWSDLSLASCNECHPNRWNHSATNRVFSNMLWFEDYEAGRSNGRYPNNPHQEKSK